MFDCLDEYEKELIKISKKIYLITGVLIGYLLAIFSILLVMIMTYNLSGG